MAVCESSMNVFIVGSPWHAIVAKAIIDKKSLVDSVFVVEKISDSSCRQILNMLKDSKIHAVFSHENTRFITIKSKGLFGFLSSMSGEFVKVSRSVKSLKNLLSAEKKNTDVYYFNFYSPLTRAFLKELRSSDLVNMHRVEDGVCDYFPFNFMNYGFFEKVAKMVLSLLCGKLELYRRSCHWLFEKTENYYLFFPKKVNLQWGAKELCSLLEVKAEIKTICGNENNDDSLCVVNSEGAVLMLGQTLYEDGICSLEDEIDLYLDVSHHMTGKVYFKPHPRSSREKVDLLVVAGMTVIKTDSTAEVLICRFKFGCIVGMWSNTIVYSRDVFGVNSYSMLHGLLDRSDSKTDSHVIRIHRVLREKFDGCYVDFRVCEK